jgi:uncharacterized protein
LAAFGPVYLHRDGDDFRRARGWTVDGLTYRQAFLGAGTLAIADARPADLAAGSETLVDNPVGGACTRSTYVGTFGIPPQTPCTSNNRVNDTTTQNYDLPLTEDLKLTGPFAARLNVSTDGRDAYAVVRVEDVAPDGSVKELTVGWDTLSFRALDDAKSDKVGDLYVRPHHPYTKDSVLPTNAGPYEWWIEIRPTSVRVPAGHTLRLAIGTADTIRFIPTVRSMTERGGSVLTIHHDAEHPSALILPVESE